MRILLAWVALVAMGAQAGDLHFESTELKASTQYEIREASSNQVKIQKLEKGKRVGSLELSALAARELRKWIEQVEGLPSERTCFLGNRYFWNNGKQAWVACRSRPLMGAMRDLQQALETAFTFSSQVKHP